MTHYLLAESTSPLNAVLTTLVLLAVLLGAPAVGGAQTFHFTGYDTFDAAPTINGTLWSGFEQNTIPAAIANRDVLRKIIADTSLPGNRFLQESLTTVTTVPGSSTGRAGQGRLVLRINREDIRTGATVTGIALKGLVVSASAPKCPDNMGKRRERLGKFWGFSSTTARARGRVTGPEMSTPVWLQSSIRSRGDSLSRS